MSSRSREKFMVSSLLSLTSAAPFQSRLYQSPSRLFSRYHEELGISPVIQKPCPFKLRWMNGYNHRVGVINLNNNGSTTLFYSASNCGVLYNWTTHQMWLLKGHRHMITCIASDEKGKWLVTADSGPENVLIVWDFKDLFPQRTFFTPHGNAKIAKVAISADAKYMLTIAYPSEKMMLYWWIWSYGLETPHATFETSDIPRDGVIDVGFNPAKTQQFLIMTRNNIFLGYASKIVVMERGVERITNQWQLKVNAQDKVNPEYGKLLCFTFVKSTSQIIVGTSRGAVLVYGYSMAYNLNVEDSDDIYKLKYIKMLKLDKRMIHVVKSVDNVIVTGNSAGEIHFYDDQLKLVYWVHGFTVDRVKGLSFNISPRTYMMLDPKCNKPCPCWEKVELEKDPETGETKQKLIKMRLPTDATVGGKQFLVRDFIVCTHNQGVRFVDFVTEKYKIILDNKRSYIVSLTVHPEKQMMRLYCFIHLLCVGYKDGVVELFNFTQHKLIRRVDLRGVFTVVETPDEDSTNSNYDITVPDLSVTCLQYAPSGMHLSCGLNTGQVLFLDPTTIDILTPMPFFDTCGSIKYISFSVDSRTMATADEDRAVCVYKYDCSEFVWNFVGKHRSHYKEITALTFLPAKTSSGEFKLVSLGLDRCMVEYDIAASGGGILEIASLDRVEQTAVPLTAIVWPTPDEVLQNPECRTNLPTILMATDEFKYKIVNYATTMTLATVLGPRYDYPVSKMQLITKNKKDEEGSKYLLFVCKDVVGLQKMPLDGNPWKHVALLAHPAKVLQMCFREDLGILFTIGAKDSILSQWSVKYSSVDATAKRGGIELDPYYCLVDDGRPGWLFQEIRDLFYYIQILCQGTFSPARRLVKDYIPIDSLPDLMRALGFFASEYEVENLIVEAKYKVYLKKPVTEVDFEEFVKLYLNHRPVFGESFRRLRSAFRTFSDVGQNMESYMNREDFIDMLSTNGEYFSRELCWYLLTILTGHSFEDRALMTEEDFSFLPEDTNETSHTFESSYKLFTSTVLMRAVLFGHWIGWTGAVTSFKITFKNISFSHFVTEIIGIQELDNTSILSGAESIVASSHTSFDSDEKLN